MPFRSPTELPFFARLSMFALISVAIGLLVAGLLVPAAGLAGWAGQSLERTAANLPVELQAEPLAQRTRVLDVHGNLIATFYDQHRINVPLEKVAPVLQQAVLAIEDDRFYEHGAIDFKGTLRAFLTNQAQGGVTQGGSSITQQMVKMTQVNQATTREEREAATADTYERKLQELRYAIGFEQKYSKDWIFERYLNLAYFGDGAYGIQSAARHFFGKSAAKLSLRQAALLAGLVKNPSGYDPTRFPERALERRNVVLQRMAELGMITHEKAAEVSKKKLGLKLTPMRNGCLGSEAAFFCDYVRRYLLADPALGETRADRNHLLNAGGLTIKTTLDMRFQRSADAATRAAVYPTDNAIGAIAMVEPGTGKVFAISQSRPMGRNVKKGETFLNYVVDAELGDANGFQAGSTFKVFVLAAALEQGISPSTSFNSPQQYTMPQNQFENCDGPYSSYDTWTVRNSTGSGRFDMYRGTRQSINTYYMKLQAETGLCEPFKLAQDMGVHLDDPEDERVPSFVFGVANVSPLEMANAYATFGARGKACEARPVTEIRNSAGEVFKKYPAKCRQVMSENTADIVNDILRGVMQPGGFGARLALNKPSAGKTGTINSNMAVWFNGYTPTMSAASMIAGANQNGHWVTLNRQSVGGRYVSSAFGSTLAGPMWADAMRGIQDHLEYENFTQPAFMPSRNVSDPVPVAPPEEDGKNGNQKNNKGQDGKGGKGGGKSKKKD